MYPAAQSPVQSPSRPVSLLPAQTRSPLAPLQAQAPVQSVSTQPILPPPNIEIIPGSNGSKSSPLDRCNSLDSALPESPVNGPSSSIENLNPYLNDKALYKRTLALAKAFHSIQEHRHVPGRTYFWPYPGESVSVSCDGGNQEQVIFESENQKTLFWSAHQEIKTSEASAKKERIATPPSQRVESENSAKRPRKSLPGNDPKQAKIGSFFSPAPKPTPVPAPVGVSAPVTPKPVPKRSISDYFRPNITPPSPK